MNLVFALSIWLLTAQHDTRDPVCGTITGWTAQDQEHLHLFCTLYASAGLREGTITRARANETALWLEVSTLLAAVIRQDSASAEPLVKNLMANWRVVTGQRSVQVTVESAGAAIAEGTTTLGADRVRVR